MSVGVFLWQFGERFNRDRTTTLAASVAFYTALSLAPLLMLFVTISSQFSDQLQTTFVDQIRSLIGSDAAQAVELVISNAKSRPDLSSLTGIFGVLTLFLSASLIFGEMRTALNQIFEIKMEEDPEETFFQSVVGLLKARIFHVGLALSFIFLLVVSMIVSSVISSSVLRGQNSWAGPVDVLLSAVSYVGLFSLLFRYLPDRRLSWKKAVRGALFTSVLFVIGKEAIGFYLGNSALSSSYGAAGSLVLLLAWVYYSALITFVGAQVSSLIGAARSEVL